MRPVRSKRVCGKDSRPIGVLFGINQNELKVFFRGSYLTLVCSDKDRETLVIGRHYIVENKNELRRGDTGYEDLGIERLAMDVVYINILYEDLVAFVGTALKKQEYVYEHPTLGKVDFLNENNIELLKTSKDNIRVALFDTLNDLSDEFVKSNLKGAFAPGMFTDGTGRWVELDFPPLDEIYGGNFGVRNMIISRENQKFKASKSNLSFNPSDIPSLDGSFNSGKRVKSPAKPQKPNFFFHIDSLEDIVGPSTRFWREPESKRAEESHTFRKQSSDFMEFQTHRAESRGSYRDSHNSSRNHRDSQSFMRTQEKGEDLSKTKKTAPNFNFNLGETKSHFESKPFQNRNSAQSPMWTADVDEPEEVEESVDDIDLSNFGDETDIHDFQVVEEPELKSTVENVSSDDDDNPADEDEDDNDEKRMGFLSDSDDEARQKQYQSPDEADAEFKKPIMYNLRLAINEDADSEEDSGVTFPDNHLPTGVRLPLPLIKPVPDYRGAINLNNDRFTAVIGVAVVFDGDNTAIRTHMGMHKAQMRIFPGTWLKCEIYNNVVVMARVITSPIYTRRIMHKGKKKLAFFCQVSRTSQGWYFNKYLGTIVDKRFDEKMEYYIKKKMRAPFDIWVEIEFFADVPSGTIETKIQKFHKFYEGGAILADEASWFDGAQLRTKLQKKMRDEFNRGVCEDRCPMQYYGQVVEGRRIEAAGKRGKIYYMGDTMEQKIALYKAEFEKGKKAREKELEERKERLLNGDFTEEQLYDPNESDANFVPKFPNLPDNNLSKVKTVADMDKFIKENERKKREEERRRQRMLYDEVKKEQGVDFTFNLPDLKPQGNVNVGDGSEESEDEDQLFSDDLLKYEWGESGRSTSKNVAQKKQPSETPTASDRSRMRTVRPSGLHPDDSQGEDKETTKSSFGTAPNMNSGASFVSTKSKLNESMFSSKNCDSNPFGTVDSFNKAYFKPAESAANLRSRTSSSITVSDTSTSKVSSATKLKQSTTSDGKANTTSSFASAKSSRQSSNARPSGSVQPSTSLQKESLNSTLESKPFRQDSTYSDGFSIRPDHSVFGKPSFPTNHNTCTPEGSMIREREEERPKLEVVPPAQRRIPYEWNRPDSEDEAAPIKKQSTRVPRPQAHRPSAAVYVVGKNEKNNSGAPQSNTGPWRSKVIDDKNHPENLINEQLKPKRELSREELEFFFGTPLDYPIPSKYEALIEDSQCLQEPIQCLVIHKIQDHGVVLYEMATGKFGIMLKSQERVYDLSLGCILHVRPYFLNHPDHELYEFHCTRVNNSNIELPSGNILERTTPFGTELYLNLLSFELKCPVKKKGRFYAWTKFGEVIIPKRAAFSRKPYHFVARMGKRNFTLVDGTLKFMEDFDWEKYLLPGAKLQYQQMMQRKQQQQREQQQQQQRAQQQQQLREQHHQQNQRSRLSTLNDDVFLSANDPTTPTPYKPSQFTGTKNTPEHIPHWSASVASPACFESRANDFNEQTDDEVSTTMRRNPTGSTARRELDFGRDNSEGFRRPPSQQKPAFRRESEQEDFRRGQDLRGSQQDFRSSKLSNRDGRLFSNEGYVPPEQDYLQEEYPNQQRYNAQPPPWLQNSARNDNRNSWNQANDQVERFGGSNLNIQNQGQFGGNEPPSGRMSVMSGRYGNNNPQFDGGYSNQSSYHGGNRNQAPYYGKRPQHHDLNSYGRGPLQNPNFRQGYDQGNFDDRSNDGRYQNSNPGSQYFSQSGGRPNYDPNMGGTRNYGPAGSKGYEQYGPANYDNRTPNFGASRNQNYGPGPQNYDQETRGDNYDSRRYSTQPYAPTDCGRSSSRFQNFDQQSVSSHCPNNGPYQNYGPNGPYQNYGPNFDQPQQRRPSNYEQEQRYAYNGFQNKYDDPRYGGPNYGPNLGYSGSRSYYDNPRYDGFDSNNPNNGYRLDNGYGSNNLQGLNNGYGPNNGYNNRRDSYNSNEGPSNGRGYEQGGNEQGFQGQNDQRRYRDGVQDQPKENIREGQKVDNDKAKNTKETTSKTQSKVVQIEEIVDTTTTTTVEKQTEPIVEMPSSLESESQFKIRIEENTTTKTKITSEEPLKETRKRTQMSPVRQENRVPDMKYSEDEYVSEEEEDMANMSDDGSGFPSFRNESSAHESRVLYEPSYIKEEPAKSTEKPVEQAEKVAEEVVNLQTKTLASEGKSRVAPKPTAPLVFMQEEEDDEEEEL
ncbi:unnamed protein product [Bursaphelenchus okinawaensis]|uniref:Uncharacterized protein n=1 Tax=Bursaphelenchus okinawaensis TaxID=465554 RepID=A0A811JV37_9BILA|nr:unnamed protein product [Bursaphelenchus okinawaensis]CAG9083950.1 unnamed protein product [Bursaphelenchus okinawaensis]